MNKKTAHESKLQKNDSNQFSSSDNLKDFSAKRGDATNRVGSRKLNMGLNMNQIKSLNKLNIKQCQKKQV